MNKHKYAIGVDFGSDSVRALVVRCDDGEVLGSCVSKYERWTKGLYCKPELNQFRQHPQDYIDGIKRVVTGVLRELDADIVESIVAISVATTGSTPIAVDREGVPLSLRVGFEENPNAMFVLWKDHTATKEAEEINLACSTNKIDYLKYVGGAYSSEWFWAKVLNVLRKDKEVRDAAFSWVEHCDWITALLTGNTDPLKIKRSRCAAGHKAMWHEEWEGLPSEEFLAGLDPLLKGLRSKLYHETNVSGEKAGVVSEFWANELGLPKGVVVGVGSFDAHMGAIGGEIKPNHLVKVIGTSTCDMIVVPKEQMEGKFVSGICGQVDGSILPKMIGLEAGQSAFGDIYAWFREILMWPVRNSKTFSGLVQQSEEEGFIVELENEIIPNLVAEAQGCSDSESTIIALDWMNGRRTPDSNQNLKGAIHGLTLGTTPPKIFKALVEATAFGSKMIIDQFKKEGVSIQGVIAVGGVAQKSDFVMQILSDVLNMEIQVARSKETCALGAAMSAAVAAGFYQNFTEAQQAMGAGVQKKYQPIPENVDRYKKLYLKYQDFGAFIENSLTA